MNVVQFVPKLKVAKRRRPPPLPMLAELLAIREKVRARNSERTKRAWAKPEAGRRGRGEVRRRTCLIVVVIGKLLSVSHTINCIRYGGKK